MVSCPAAGHAERNRCMARVVERNVGVGHPGQKIRVYLNPREMEIKNDSPREIDVPYDLMEKLWAYSLRHRQRRADANREGEAPPHLFLTEAGAPYKKDSITGIFRALTKRVGFPCAPFPGQNNYSTGAKALSAAERLRVMVSLCELTSRACARH